MQEWFSAGPANPSGSHRLARAARARLEDARDVVAGWLAAPTGDVIFTSGGTEADNLAVLGSLPGRPGAVVISAVEHPAVREAALASGREVRAIPVQADGLIDPDRLRGLLDGEVAVVSIQLANHETGVIQPLAGLISRVRKWAPGAVFHTDAVQAAGWLDVARATEDADLVSVSAHKFGGPQGCGVLAVRHGLAISSIQHGGGQERERRAGTQNVAGAVGMAAAVTALGEAAGRERTAAAVAARRDRLSAGVRCEVPDAVETAAGVPRLPGHCHLRLPGLESEALLFLLDEAGICASAGAACASGAIEPSPVLLAMGLGREAALSAVRLTLGPETTDADVAEAVAAVGAAVRALCGAVSGQAV